MLKCFIIGIPGVHVHVRVMAIGHLLPGGPGRGVHVWQYLRLPGCGVLPLSTLYRPLLCPQVP